MPYRTIQTLEAWLREFEQRGRVGASTIRVVPQDGADGADTGLVVMQLPNSPAVIYVEPPTGDQAEWTVMFEPREQAVRLVGSQVQSMAVEMAALAQLCAFLQEKYERYRYLAEHG
jgi:hypothetical protein